MNSSISSEARKLLKNILQDIKLLLNATQSTVDPENENYQKELIELIQKLKQNFDSHYELLKNKIELLNQTEEKKEEDFEEKQILIEKRLKLRSKAQKKNEIIKEITEEFRNLQTTLNFLN
ncbi:hypothetical protein M0811_12119 [Anaeramoeba ignava]|uniref:Uncharacterized protein n=1 Tax=Anaeramoeba ignava TaxID=1746090 RepID=A0A9Q0L9S5_ANAIG|nr:hypothetical protein M0811_12119 [Anaeramoeba ignava]